MFAQMPLFVYRHFTGALCTTSSEGRFALFSVPSTPAFLLGSGLSNSSDMVRSPTSWSRLQPQLVACALSAPNSKLFAGNYGCNRRSHLAHGTPQGGAGTGCEAVCCGRAGCEGEGRLRCDLAAPTRNRPSGVSSSLSRRRASRCRHRRTCCRSGQNQTSADGTLQQAIAHTRTCQFTATSRVRSFAYEGDVLTIVPHRQRAYRMSTKR